MEKEEIRRILRKYYLHENSTLILIFFFITLFIVIIFQQIPIFSVRNSIIKIINFENLEDLVNEILSLINGIVPLLVSVIIFGLYKFFRKRIEGIKALPKIIFKKQKNGEEKEIENVIIREYNENKVTIPRTKSVIKMNEFFERSFKNKKNVFFVGKSGSGKSLLLRAFIKEYGKNENISIFSTSDANNYEKVYDSSTRIKEELNKITEKYGNSNIRHIIIFDQFEKLILPRYKDHFIIIKDFLKIWKNTAISAIFVCTNDDYIDVLKKLVKSLDVDKTSEMNNEHVTDIYFPVILPEEKEFILNLMIEKFQVKKKEDIRYVFFEKKLLADLEDVSLIEINTAIKYVERVTEKIKYENVFDKSDDTRELIFEEYLERVFERLEHPVTAMVILYSLCCSNGLLYKSDFQNITFQPKEDVGEILESLRTQTLIEPTQKSADSDIFPYILTHEYLIEKLKSYCKEHLSALVIVNIDFYCNEINKLMENNNKSDSREPSVYYKNTITDKKYDKILLNFLCVLCGLIVGIYVWYEIIEFNTKYLFFKYELDHTIFALTVLAMAGPIFYIYHYLLHFAKIFFIKTGNKTKAEAPICVFLVVWGIISILLSLIFNELWATWLAIEWILVAALHLVLSKKSSLNKQAADRLKGEGTFYMVVASLMIGANFAFLLIDGLGRVVMEFWFIIFFVLFILIIRQHINTDYMLAKLTSFVTPAEENDSQ
ncbi:MAG: hypothetical protein LBH43_10030 [Treponema sp.]|jgi:hypothetical protein|nr:hypothetical protein [Treponema sp.]